MDVSALDSRLFFFLHRIQAGGATTLPSSGPIKRGAMSTVIGNRDDGNSDPIMPAGCQLQVPAAMNSSRIIKSPRGSSFFLRGGLFRFVGPPSRTPGPF